MTIGDIKARRVYDYWLRCWHMYRTTQILSHQLKPHETTGEKS
jgi:hypothetical protein